MLCSLVHLSYNLLTCIFVLEKQIYNGLPDLMTKVASSELQKLDDEVQECQVIYLPQVIAESEMSEWLNHLATWLT